MYTGVWCHEYTCLNRHLIFWKFKPAVLLQDFRLEMKYWPETVAKSMNIYSLLSSKRKRKEKKTWVPFLGWEATDLKHMTVSSRAI